MHKLYNHFLSTEPKSHLLTFFFNDLIKFSFGKQPKTKNNLELSDIAKRIKYQCF